MELCHHGILGMRWGVRRYQNKDGSLTPAGIKRYNKEMDKLRNEEIVLANKRATAAKLSKLENARKRVEEQKADLKKKNNEVKDSSDSEKKEKKKSISEMNMEELNSYKQRLSTEKDVYDLQTKISDLKQPNEALVVGAMKKYGPKIVGKVWDDVAKPSINKYLEKRLGLKEPTSELDKLKKEADIWKNKEIISKAKNTIWNNEKNKREHEEARLKKEKEAYEKESKQRQKYEEAQKQVDDYNKNWYENDNQSGTYSKKGSDIKDSKLGTGNKKNDSVPLLETVEKYEASGKDVFGKGTSKFEGFSKTPVKDVVWDGNKYVDELLMLEDRRR